MQRLTNLVRFAGLAVAIAAAGCHVDSGGGDDTPDDSDAGVADVDAGPDDEKTEWDLLLESRVVDYNAALRIASLRLTGELPTLAQVKFVADAGDQKSAYEALVGAYLEDVAFSRQMISFWQDTFRMGGTAELESAPVFAAQLVVEDRSYNELLLTTTGTCPTYDAETNTFVPADCANNVPVHAGVLSHPGMNAHFTSNMAFRRTRWVQEVFACTAYPAEIGVEPVDVGGNALYTAPWPFYSIAGEVSGGAVDFLDTSAVACANCHATMNHVAPLFGNFDETGMWSADIQVTNPTDGQPITAMTDWLPLGETPGWRFDSTIAVSDLPSLGAAMVADPDIAECAVARMWNWAFGKGDIVDTLAQVPAEVIATQVGELRGNGMRLKPILFSVFTSDDFVKF
jgi:hypothetical protein